MGPKVTRMKCLLKIIIFELCGPTFNSSGCQARMLLGAVTLVFDSLLLKVVYLKKEKKKM